MDAIDYDGTFRTGTLEFGNNIKREDEFIDQDYDTLTTKYAYVDTLLLANWRGVCKGISSA
jgi:hypothetical protein